MKKILIICKRDIIGNILREQLLKSIKGAKEVDSVDEADEIYVKYEEGRIINFDKPTFYFTANEKGKIIFVNPKEDEWVKTVKFNGVEQTTIKGIDFNKQVFSFLRFILRGEEFETSEILGWESIYVLAQFMFKELSHDFKKLMLSNGFEEDELDELQKLVNETSGYKDNKLSHYLRMFKYINFRNSSLLPNMGDNIFVNCISLQYNDLWSDKKLSKASKDGIKADLDNNKAKELELIGAINKTLKESTIGSSAFKRYFFGDNRGMYLLFVPDETLKDGEIMIPAPTFKDDVKGYPQIGKTVVATRHPITTLILEFKVKGYTLDGSIRTNSHTALALYGDADGDSQSVCFNPPKMKYSGIKELENFRNVAGIKVNKPAPKCKQFSIDDFADVEPAENKEKLYKTSIEQATAKMVTKELTGAFGSVERATILTMLSNNIKITEELLYQKSWLSQIPVQAKNVLESLKKGELSELDKNTILLFVAMSKDVNIAIRTVSLLLGLTPDETRNKIVEWKTGIIENQEEMVDLISGYMKKLSEKF